MKTIVWQDRTSGALYIYLPNYPTQRSLFEQKRIERILSALTELETVGNINIFLYKHGRLRKISEHRL